MTRLVLCFYCGMCWCTLNPKILWTRCGQAWERTTHLITSNLPVIALSCKFLEPRQSIVSIRRFLAQLRKDFNPLRMEICICINLKRKLGAQTLSYALSRTDAREGLQGLRWSEQRKARTVPCRVAILIEFHLEAKTILYCESNLRRHVNKPSFIKTQQRINSLKQSPRMQLPRELSCAVLYTKQRIAIKVKD